MNTLKLISFAGLVLLLTACDSSSNDIVDEMGDVVDETGDAIEDGCEDLLDAADANRSDC